MPSTPSPLLRIQLMTTGDQAGQWGDTTNVNLGTLLEGAIAGLATVSVTSANQALQTVDYLADQSRMAIISLSTTTAANFNVYAPPNVTKTYVIQNTSAYTATIYNSTTVGGTTAAGSGVTVPAGGIAYVFSTGSNFFSLNSLYGGSTAALRVDSSGNVGIGTNAPSGKLDVVGDGGTVVASAATNTAATSAQIQIKNSAGAIVFRTVYYGPSYSGGSAFSVGANGTALYQEASAPLAVGTGVAQPLLFGTNGNERMRIDSSGNVGIGTSPPQARLQVAATSPTRGITSILGATGSTGVQLQMTQAAIDDWVIGQPAGVSAFAIWSGRNTANDGNERMRITSGGSVGIGTDTPRAQTHVFGLGQSVANLTDGGNRGGMLRVSDNNSVAGSGGAVLFASQQGDSANSLGFAAIKGILTSGAGNTVGDLSVSFRANTGDTNLTELIRITSSGNIGLGTSSPGGNKISALTSPGTNSSARFSNTTASAEVGVNSSSQAYFGSTSNHVTRLVQNNTAQLQINTSGLVQIDNGYGSLATFYGCRAWINFDGTSGSIGTGRGSGNVSSVTDNGAGNYTINFTTAMPDTNYAVTGTANGRNTHPARVVGAGYSGDTFSTSAVQIRTGTAGGSGANGTTEDCEYVFVAIFR